MYEFFEKLCVKRIKLFIFIMALLFIFIVLSISAPFLVTSKECKWNSSQDFEYGQPNDANRYRLHARSYSQDYIYNSTYFRIERLVQDQVKDVIVIGLREAEALVKFMRSPSDSISINNGLREFHLSSTRITQHNLVEMMFIYSNSTKIKYIHFGSAKEIANTLDSVISEILFCAFEMHK